MISFAMRRLLAALAVAAFSTTAFAQDYPKRPITMIVPFAAGGTSDVIARTVAEQMSAALGQTIVIENVAGAGGSTALARASRAEPDGYTIAIGNAGTNAATYTIYPKLPFAPDSFVPIAMVAKTFGIIALRKEFPAKDLEGVHRLRQGEPRQDQSRPCRRRLVELPHLQKLRDRGRDRRDAGRLSRRRASADGRDRQPDRRRLRCRGLRLAGDQRQAGEGARGRLHCARLARCPICPLRPKRVCRNSRRRAGTACSRPRARPRPSSRSSMPPRVRRSKPTPSRSALPICRPLPPIPTSTRPSRCRSW